MSTAQGPWLAGVVTAWLSGKTIKALLVDGSHAEDPDTQYRSSITHEVTGTGYSAGGVTVSGVSATYDAANDRVVLDCSDVVFTTVTIAAIGGIVFYHSTGSSATDTIIAQDTWTPTESATAENYTYAPNALGIVTMGLA